MKKRLIFNQIIEHIDGREALIITGMRQVGKTTLMRQIFESVKSQNKIWFDFENPFDVKVFEDIDYKNIYKKIKSQISAPGRLFVFIDEIQIFPEISKIIKYLVDHFQVKFVVTGSSNYYLKNLFPESLAGRKFLFELNPLSFQEYLYFKDIIPWPEADRPSLPDRLSQSDILRVKKYETDYEDYLRYGGFPAVVLAPAAKTKELVIKNIFSSFFEKDLKVLSDYKDIQELRDLLLLLVPRVGSMLDVSRLASELAVNRPKVYQYLEFLQGTFVIRLLPRFAKGIDRSVAGGKKVYFSDTGLLNAIGQVNDAQLFENAVVNQLLSYGPVSFFNKRNQAEIDAIWDKKIAFEIKLKGTDNDAKKLKALSAGLGIKTCKVLSKSFVEKEGFVSPLVL